MIRFTTAVRIRRPIADVYAFLSDPLNLPLWNSAVLTISRTRERESNARPTYTMQRELPTRHVRNQLEIFARVHPTGFAIRTTSGPTPFTYRYTLNAANGQTVIQLDAMLEPDAPATLLGPLAGRAVKRGADDNLAELKRILEAPVPPA